MHTGVLVLAYIGNRQQDTDRQKHATLVSPPITADGPLCLTVRWLGMSDVAIYTMPNTSAPPRLFYESFIGVSSFVHQHFEVMSSDFDSSTFKLQFKVTTGGRVLPAVSLAVDELTLVTGRCRHIG